MVRISLLTLSNIELSPAFKNIGKPVVSNNELVVSNAAASMSKLMKRDYLDGGNFSNIDTPHFDKQLNATLFSYDAKFF